jgi:drug/metabolite transporter (DMT)-like permease
VLLALSSQVLGWMLISVSLPRLPAAITSIVLMLQPMTTVLLGAVLLSEKPSAVQLSGVFVVLAGVAFATLGARSREYEPA